MTLVEGVLAFCQKNIGKVKTLIWVFLLIPTVQLVLVYFDDQEINVFERLSALSGQWAFNCLILCLCITPLRRWLALLNRFLKNKYGRRLGDWNWLIRCRRLVGLFSFYYACLHFYIYLALEVDFDLAEALLDIGERYFLWFGVASFVMLVVLALTSPQIALRKLGRYWRRIHRSVYVVAILCGVHYILVEKSGEYLGIVYSTIVGVLLLERCIFAFVLKNKLPDDDGMEATRVYQKLGVK